MKKNYADKWKKINKKSLIIMKKKYRFNRNIIYCEYNGFTVS